MHPIYATYIDELEDGLLYEPPERTSDIQFPPAMNTLLLALWLLLCAVGFGIVFLAKNPIAGAVVIAVPTFVGMLIKPTFALCILMLVLPTGAGIGFRQAFSLDRAVGLALATSFLINAMLTRPGIRIRHKALWVAAALSVWIFLASLPQPYLKMEIMRSFTQFQLVVLILIAYWILETNSERTFLWALRSYVVGMVGTTVLAFKTGAAIRAMHETRDTRYAATLGSAIDANMLAALTALAFLSAIYLFARDKSLFWRAVYLVAILFLPVMMLKIGSRGGLVALAFTMLSPLLFVRQVLRRPTLAVLLLLAILLASVSVGFLIKRRGLDSSVASRLTDVSRAKQAIDFRMQPIKKAITSAAERPAGAGYYSWFERTDSLIWPHNDFFFSLGVYGIPGAILFTAFVILLMLTVKRMPLTLEKLYARAVLTFLLVMGLNIKQLSAKYYWVFLAFVLAAERLSAWRAETNAEDIAEDVDEDVACFDD
ncbi:MAG: hypothetical protein JSW27_09320 [Phycisphaerales bacterium]|nr:MAG: hypothetical protein JSW27_09320 [Phycisphaerales bacterium]